MPRCGCIPRSYTETTPTLWEETLLLGADPTGERLGRGPIEWTWADARHLRRRLPKAHAASHEGWPMAAGPVSRLGSFSRLLRALQLSPHLAPIAQTQQARQTRQTPQYTSTPAARNTHNRTGHKRIKRAKSQETLRSPARRWLADELDATTPAHVETYTCARNMAEAYSHQIWIEYAGDVLIRRCASRRPAGRGGVEGVNP